MGFQQLIINPGSTSTKLALYDGKERVVQENIEHRPEELQGYARIPDQLPFRMGVIRGFMARNGIDGKKLSAVMGRGGLVLGLKTGGYLVDDALYTALSDNRYSQPHASNLEGCWPRPWGTPSASPPTSMTR